MGTYWKDAYGISLRANGENHPVTVLLMGNLGAVLSQLGEFTKAENYIRREYELSKMMYGVDSVDTYPIQQNLAEIEIQLGNIDSAAGLMPLPSKFMEYRVTRRWPGCRLELSSRGTPVVFPIRERFFANSK